MNLRDLEVPTRTKPLAERHLDVICGLIRQRVTNMQHELAGEQLTDPSNVDLAIRLLSIEDNLYATGQWYARHEKKR